MKVLYIVLVASFLSGCLASTTSPKGINCNYSQGKAMWELPLLCQPNGG